jgi:hypothetical protein
LAMGASLAGPLVESRTGRAGPEAQNARQNDAPRC